MLTTRRTRLTHHIQIETMCGRHCGSVRRGGDGHTTRCTVHSTLLVASARPNPRRNARDAPHLVSNDARRPKLRRTTRLPRFLHLCPEHNGSECAPTPSHRRATALHRILHRYVVRRCRMAGHTMHLRWRPGAALSSVVELAPRRVAPWSARCAAAQLNACATRGAGCVGAQR